MRVIQVGIGKFGRSWTNVIRNAEGIEFVGIVDPVPAAQEWAQRELGFAPEQCFDSLDDALKREDWDAAVVVTPPATHRAAAETILRGGRDVLLEKPLATTLEDARALVATAEETGRILMASQNYRHRGPLRTVQRLIAAGEIGELRAVDIAFRRDTRTLFGEGDFRYVMPHVLILDMAIHQFDMLRALSGQNATRVYAQSWHVPDGVYQYDAAATVVITLENGAVVTYVGNWATSDPETSWDGDWDIVGETGRIRWTADPTGENVSVRVQHWGGEWRDVEIDEVPATDRAGTLRAFREAVATRTQPETSAADNIHSLGIVLGAVESVETGQAVTLDPA